AGRVRTPGTGRLIVGHRRPARGVTSPVLAPSRRGWCGRNRESPATALTAEATGTSGRERAGGAVSGGPTGRGLLRTGAREAVTWSPPGGSSNAAGPVGGRSTTCGPSP